MRILWLAFLYTVSTSAEGYGGSWLEPPSPQAPSFQRPVDAVTDVINELGVRILQEYGESRDNGNVAFSPTGIGFVLAALYEGSAGTGNEQIAHALGLPRDRDITRIGLRDIHRRLRSYLSPDGFLGGLTLNRENTKLRPEYEDILKFLGFDFPSSDDGANATDSTTSIPETISEVPTTPVDSAETTSSPTSSEASESPVTSMTSTEETTSIVTSKIGDDVTTTTPVPEEDASEASSTSTMKEVTTPDTSPDETTTLKRDDDGVVTMGTQEISDPTTTTTSTVEFIEELSSTMEISTAQSTTVSSSTTVLTTTESPTTVPEVSTGPTEDSSAIPTVAESTESLSSTQPTTMLAMIDAPSTVAKEPEMMSTTLASMEEMTETTKLESTTLQAEGPVSPGTTTSMVSESSDISTTESTTVTTLDEEESNVEVVDTSEDISEVETSSLNPEESLEELTTTSAEGSSASEPEGTPINEIVYESTAIPIDTTTVDEINAVETIPNVNETDSESENLLSIEDKNMNAEDTTISSSVRRRVRRIGIRDPVIRTLLDARSAKSEVEVTAKSDLSNSKESGVVWINGVVEYSFTGQNAGDSTTQQTSLQKNQSDENIEDFRKLNTGEEATIEGETKNRGTRSPRGYFFNVPDFPSFPVYPDFHGFPEETSWTRTVGGWRVHSPKTGEGSRDSSELTFLVNGEVAQVVSAATYTVVLPFAFLPTLQALALEFPLDDPRYNILLLLPTDRDGTRRLARELGNVGLRELRKELQPAWVRAVIPSFMLKGFVTLTPFLQRLGIRDVFEPRDADLSPMTEDEGVYARDVQQSIGVNIRNYMKPDRTHSRNGLFERAGPVSFVAEHPFLFFIIDAETGVSLIAGRIENPLNSRIL